ncbi:MAG: hypothetical protein ACKV0T_14705 [Planctomycetales bacterium]
MSCENHQHAGPNDSTYSTSSEISATVVQNTEPGFLGGVAMREVYRGSAVEGRIRVAAIEDQRRGLWSGSAGVYRGAASAARAVDRPPPAERTTGIHAAHPCR